MHRLLNKVFSEGCAHPLKMQLLLFILVLMHRRNQSATIYSPENSQNIRDTRAVSCQPGTYFDANYRICMRCTLCSKGSTSALDCEDFEGPGTCISCNRGYFQDMDNSTNECFYCSFCRNRVQLKGCTREGNRECGGCVEGHYEDEGSNCHDCGTLRGRNLPEACRPKQLTTTPSPALGGSLPTPSMVMDGAVTTAGAPDTTGQGSGTAADVAEFTTPMPAGLTTNVTENDQVLSMKTTAGRENTIKVGQQVESESWDHSRAWWTLSLVCAILISVTTLLCGGRFIFKNVTTRRKLTTGKTPWNPSATAGQDEEAIELQPMKVSEIADAIDCDGVPPPPTEIVDDGTSAVFIETDCLLQACGPSSVTGHSLLDSPDGFSGLLNRLNSEITPKDLTDFIQTCRVAGKLTPRSSEEAADSLMTCAELVIESNEHVDRKGFLRFLYKYWKTSRKTTLCQLIERSFPQVDGIPRETPDSPDDTDYLGKIREHLKAVNNPCMKVTDLVTLGLEVTPLVDQEVKGVGNVFQLAMDLGVDPSTAYTLKRYQSLEKTLKMSKPDLTVFRLAESLSKIKRQLAVKRIYHLLISQHTNLPTANV